MKSTVVQWFQPLHVQCAPALCSCDFHLKLALPDSPEDAKGRSRVLECRTPNWSESLLLVWPRCHTASSNSKDQPQTGSARAHSGCDGAKYFACAICTPVPTANGKRALRWEVPAPPQSPDAQAGAQCQCQWPHSARQRRPSQARFPTLAPLSSRNVKAERDARPRKRRSRPCWPVCCPCHRQKRPVNAA